MKEVWILTAVGALLAALAWIERRQHRRRLERIRIRIHVNGTRGKSSVTRLIAGSAAAAGAEALVVECMALTP
jgi:hypothetical protein